MDREGEQNLRQFLKVAIEKRRPSLSSRELARRCERYGYKVNESYVSQFLSGARKSMSFKALRPISRALGVPYLQLLLLAGYISESDLKAAGPLEITAGASLEDGVVDINWNELSSTGRRLLAEYYDFLRERYPVDEDDSSANVR